MIQFHGLITALNSNFQARWSRYKYNDYVWKPGGAVWSCSWPGDQPAKQDHVPWASAVPGFMERYKEIGKWREKAANSGNKAKVRELGTDQVMASFSGCSSYLFSHSWKGHLC